MKLLKIIFITAALSCTFVAGYTLGKHKEHHHSKNGVTGVGGIFFKSSDPAKLKKWYDDNLGFHSDQYGTMFEWRQADDSMHKGFTLWAPFKNTTKYFEKEFMINYRVRHLDALLVELAAKGITPIDSVERASYGSFVHLKDPEGNRIELWEPIDDEYEKLSDHKTVY